MSLVNGAAVHVIVPHPDGSRVRLLKTAKPLTPDESLILALHNENLRLKHDLANAECAASMAAELAQLHKTSSQEQP